MNIDATFWVAIAFFIFYLAITKVKTKESALHNSNKKLRLYVDCSRRPESDDR